MVQKYKNTLTMCIKTQKNEFLYIYLYVYSPNFAIKQVK